ncbi:Serine/threonine-protein kinase PknD [Enhygromyxa salina]|uniref:Serine/threonine-protein kinase PknD n=1 Tax=Enhygromyxa salina TaxID=215803 RepID=A0A2S9XXN7_9BACT|nr:serine/threonine-protein kinase [Enhygromyxa salina]PRP97604.1 Serine/threonine-protein kinase PknD [Enhygromyxa salina]
MEAPPGNETERAAEVRETWGAALESHGVDVSSTLLTLGQAFGELGTRSILLNREGEGEGVSLSESASRYEHLRLLGRGGMGQVDQVWDHDLMRKLAVKRLHPERAGSSLALRQFLWEARVTAHLDHPNIVPVHDLGIDEKGELYFTMKFVHGTSLDELLGALARVEKAAAEGREPTPVDEIISAEHLTQLRRVRLFIDLCQAIDFAHQRGVLHRDLKPANVMIGQYGEVLIMDWGLAQPLPGPNGEGLRELLPELVCDSQPGRPSGTPRYMSPEQVMGRPLDERSDIYALGVILYELMTLSSPYSATEVTRLLLQVSEAKIRPLTAMGPSVPDALINVVNRALAHDPDDRYPTVRALTEDIEAVLDGFGPGLQPGSSIIGETPKSWLAPPEPTRPRPPLGLVLGAGIASGLVLASLMSGWLASLGWTATVVLAIAALGLGVGALALGRDRPRDSE